MRPRTRRTEPHRHEYTGILLTGAPHANHVEFVVKANDENEKPTGEPVYRCRFDQAAPEAVASLNKANSKIGYELFAVHEWREDGPWVRQENGDHHVPLGKTLARREQDRRP